MIAADGGAESAASRARGARGRRAVHARERRGGAARGGGPARGPSRARCSSRCGSRSPERPSRPGSSRAWRCSDARRRWRESTARWTVRTAALLNPTGFFCRYEAMAGAAGRRHVPTDGNPHRNRASHPPVAKLAAVPVSATDRSVRLARAAPQRGPRPSADRRVRGARGVPGAGRVAQPACCGCSRPAIRRRPTSSPPSRPTSRSRSPCCGSPTRSRAARAGGSKASSRPSRCCRRAGVRDDRQPRAHVRLLPAQRRCGRGCPSASGCTRSRPSAPRTGSRRELGYEARDRLMVTSLLHDIGKLVLVHAYPGYPRQVHGEARTPEERLQPSGASWASTTRSSAACSRAGGACRSRSRA